MPKKNALGRVRRPRESRHVWNMLRRHALDAHPLQRALPFPLHTVNFRQDANGAKFWHDSARFWPSERCASACTLQERCRNEEQRSRLEMDVATLELILATSKLPLLLDGSHVLIACEGSHVGRGGRAGQLLTACRSRVIVDHVDARRTALGRHSVLADCRS